MLIHFVRADNSKDVFLNMEYSEWLDRIYSDGCSQRWCVDIDGVKAYDFGIERKKVITSCGTYPFASSAVGVHPDEVPEMVALDNKLGVPTEYVDGDPVFTSKSHRKKYCEAHGTFDRNAGFSDPKPKNM